MIIVAHRISTVQHCDEILVMEGGEIVERGTFQKLCDMGGKFKEIMENLKE
jgi:ATP-binding cassette, subfamily B, bacterial MsbA